MQESKYQIKHWKQWKDTRRLLNNTKNEILSGVKAITYSDELPGTANRTVLSKVNKLLEDVKIYDSYIKDYDLLINRLERTITELLSEDERKIVLIYATYPNNAEKRENKALEHGYSERTYYRILTSSLDKMDNVLAPKSPLGSNVAVNKQENEVK